MVVDGRTAILGWFAILAAQGMYEWFKRVGEDVKLEAKRRGGTLSSFGCGRLVWPTVADPARHQPHMSWSSL